MVDERSSAASGPRAFYKAVPLIERLAAMPSTDGIVSPDKIALARRRLDRWRSAAPFDREESWRERLAGVGTNEESLLRMLAEDEAALDSRLPVPDWTAIVDAAYRVPSSGPADFELPEAFAEAPFMVLVEPLIRWARKRSGEELGEIASEAADDTPAEPRALADMLLWSGLAPRLGGMVERTMLLELAVARAAGALDGDTPADRFASFVADLRRPERRFQVLTAYPVLARQLVVVTQGWLRNARRLMTRLVADRRILADTFCQGTDPGQVVEAVCRLGDPHRDGQSVTMVRFASGLRLVYKPRPVAVDMHFQALLTWLNERGVSPRFRTLTFVDRDDYGWSEFVEAAPCRTTDQIHDFYRRQGGLLATLYLLHANDFHSENIIAAGEHPVLVDLETLFQPTLPTLFPTDASDAERMASEMVDQSVLNVGLLPSQGWRAKNGAGVDTSGLGGRPGQRSPWQLPFIDGGGTDQMRIRRERLPMGEETAHRPVPPETELRLLDYADDITEGFTRTYRLFQRHRAELAAADGPLEAFGDDEVRVLIRPTMRYSTLLTTGYHPDVLRDALDRDRHFDRLWEDAARSPGLTAVIEHERRDLWNNDVPVFTARAGGKQLRDSAGASVPLPVRSGLDEVRAVVDRLGEPDLIRQTWLVRASLATTAVRRGDTMVFTGYPFEPGTRPADAGALLEGAVAVAERLMAVAVWDGAEALWVGPHSGRGGRWWMGALGPELFNGLLGIALFLAFLSEISGEASYRKLARAVTRAALRQLERGLPGEFGGLTGLGGVVYALSHLGALWEDPTLLEAARSAATRLGAVARHDTEYDVTSGSAGSLLGLVSLHRTAPCETTATAMRTIADHLVRHQHQGQAGGGWLPRGLADEGDTNRPLAGFGHGSSGIATALLAAAEPLGEERFVTAAIAGFDHERELFDPAIGHWRDVREEVSATFEMESGEEDVRSVAWCHGAPGIGLARVAALRHLDDPRMRAELDMALTTTMREGFGANHSLCHGDLGNLDLPLLASTEFGDPDLRAKAGRLAAGILRSIDERGWICGLPKGISVPGLMTGLTGIGYGLLRALRPDDVPSVLVLQPPSA